MSAALFDHLWQSTLCVGVAAVLAWVCRSTGAHVRYGIWLAASLKFLVPFSVFVALGSHVGWATPARAGGAYVSAVQAIVAPAATAAAFASATPASALATSSSAASASQMITYGPSANSPLAGAFAGGMGTCLLAVWLAGTVALSMRWLLRWNAARVLVSRATPVSFARLLLDAPLALRTTSARVEPGVFGIFRPTLLLPENIFASLPPEQLQALVAHESAHVQRRDNLTAALHSVTEMLFWFHPLVWWIGARLVAEREHACDEAVVRTGNDRQTYAQAILNVCRLYLGAPVISASGASRGHLQTRIEAILNQRVSVPIGGIKRCVLAAAAMIAVAGPIAFGLTNPARAEPAEDSLAAPTLKFATAQILRGEISMPPTISAARESFIATNATVRDLVRFAYGQRLPPQVSGGPGWLDTARYTIQASVDPAAVTDDPTAVTQRVQSLLADRFRLRIRMMKNPVYVLESADNAPKSSQKPMEKGIGLIDQKSGKVSFRGASSASVAEALSTFLASQVLDHTKPGVTYDFKMKWPRNDLKALGEQLHDQAGLTLRSFTIEQFVIDGAAQPTLDETAPSAQQIVAR